MEFGIDWLCKSAKYLTKCPPFLKAVCNLWKIRPAS